MYAGASTAGKVDSETLRGFEMKLFFQILQEQLVGNLVYSELSEGWGGFLFFHKHNQII